MKKKIITLITFVATIAAVIAVMATLSFKSQAANYEFDFTNDGRSMFKDGTIKTSSVAVTLGANNYNRTMVSDLPYGGMLPVQFRNKKGMYNTVWYNSNSNSILYDVNDKRDGDYNYTSKSGNTNPKPSGYTMYPTTNTWVSWSGSQGRTNISGPDNTNNNSSNWHYMYVNYMQSDGNSRLGVSSSYLSDDVTITFPSYSHPSYSCYSFAGWATSPNGSVSYSANTSQKFDWDNSTTISTWAPRFAYLRNGQFKRFVFGTASYSTFEYDDFGIVLFAVWNVNHNSSTTYYTATKDSGATRVSTGSYCANQTLYKWTCCSGCGANVKSAGTVTGTRGHSWGSWSPATSGYCPGQSVAQTRSCSYGCGATESQTVAGTGSHNTSGSKITEGSTFGSSAVTRSNYCPGQRLYSWTYCTKCSSNASSSTIYGNGSHNSSSTKYVASNDFSGTGVDRANYCVGQTVYQFTYCSKCSGNASAGSAVAGTGLHGTMTYHAPVAATCTATGNNAYYTCSKCTKAYQTNSTANTNSTVYNYTTAIDPNNHNWNSGSITTAATCTAAGVKTFTCTRDANHQKSEVITALGHQPMTHHAATVSTCTVHGNIDYYTCPQCSLNYSSGDTSASNTSTLNSIELPLDPDNHAWGEWVVVSKGNHGASGVQRRTCQNNASHYEDLPYDYMGDLKIAGASLSLHNNIAIRYRVAKTAFLNAGYTDPFIVFDLDGGRSETVTDYTVDGDYYIFKFSDIAPDFMNNTVRSTLYGSYGGKICQGEVKTYSIENYCYNMLHKSGYPANFYTLLVDILNYGAAAQSYTRVNDPSHNTADVELANYRITDMQSKGTSSAPTKTQINTVDALDGATVSQLGKQVVLGDSVSLRYYFELPAGANPADYKVKFKVPGLGKEYIKLIEQNAIGYYGFFNELNSGHMDQEVLVTVIDAGGSAVSSTSHYSIATYYAKNADSSNTLLANLVTAMMKYGDSAKAYAGY